MDRQTYLKRFSFAAGWYLSAAEAGDVIADYTEMLRDRPDPPSLSETMGKPRQAAKLLTEKKSYRRWLTAFAVMALCLLLPELFLLSGRFYRHPMRLMMALLLAGSAAALLWLHPRQQATKTPLPKGLLPSLAALAVVAVLAVLVLVGLSKGDWETMNPQQYGVYARLALGLCGTAATVAAFLGLVFARTADHRWRALYIMGLTALIISTLVTATLVSMNLSIASPNFLQYYLLGLDHEVIGLAVFGAAGLTATGVSLC